MFEPAVFCIRLQGRLSENWSEFFGTKSISFVLDEDGHCTTTLISEPLDQAALVGMISMLNGLGLPVVSVERLIAHEGHEQLETNDI
jgi:hypothetical protein